MSTKEEFYKQIANCLDSIIVSPDELTIDEKCRLTSFFYFFKSKFDDLNRENITESALKYTTKKYSVKIIDDVKNRETVITELLTLDKTIESEIIQMLYGIKEI